jgi:hypothetical protein
MNIQVRMLFREFVAKFFEPIQTPGDEHERGGLSCELARKLAANPSGCARD